MSLIKRANSLFKNARNTKKSSRPFKNYNFLTPEFVRRQEARFKSLLASYYESANERKLWNQYERIVKESFKAENVARKFRLSHIDQLKIQHQILFLYSKKDIGKTRQLGKLLTDIKANDPDAQVVFIRNSKEELEGFKRTMNDSIHWPTWTNGEYVYWKDEVKRGRKHPRPCGFMAYASGYGFIKWQGSEFDNVKFWMWDECNSLEGGLTYDVFMSINVFLSSIIRDKDNVRGFMFGNLIDKNNIFLDRLGVGSQTRLKIFPVHEDGDTRKPVLSTLLYLNTGDLFSGIEKQKGLLTHTLTDEEQLSLLSNRPGMVEGSKSIYEELDLKKYRGYFCFVFRRITETIGGRAKRDDFILYLYKVPASPRFVCWIDQYRPGFLKPGFKYIVSYEKEVANSYESLIALEKEEFGDGYIETLGQILEVGELWFGWNNSQDIFEEMWPGWETKFLQSDDKSV